MLKDTPVITLIGCRNMWLMVQEKVKKLLAESEAKLIGNVVKVDQSNDWASFITTPLWMLTGKKKNRQAAERWHCRKRNGRCKTLRGKTFAHF